MVDLNKLAAEIHEAAVKKGFWSVEDAEEKHLAKMISELGEVVQADRAGIMYEVEHEGAKPEGVIAELADFVMMVLDMQVQFGNEFPEQDIETWNEHELKEEIGNNAIYSLVILLGANLLNSVCIGDEDPVLIMIYTPYKWCKCNGFDLWEIIRQKMAYNESRPALHGRLY
jgi:hypothetical protein